MMVQWLALHVAAFPSPSAFLVAGAHPIDLSRNKTMRYYNNQYINYYYNYYYYQCDPSLKLSNLKYFDYDCISFTLDVLQALNL